MYLLALEANGGNLLRTSKETGVPIKTIQQWRDGLGINPDVVDLSNEQKPDLADRYDQIAHQALDLAPDKITEANFSQLMTGAAIATDKARLLRGESTSNTRTEYVEVPGARTAKILDMTERLRKVS